MSATLTRTWWRSKGETDKPVVGTERNVEEAQQLSKEIGKQREKQALSLIGTGSDQLSDHPQTELENPKEAKEEAGPNPTGS